MNWPSGKPQRGRRTDDGGQRSPARPGLRPPSSVLCLLSSVLCLLVLGAVLLANSMTKEVGRDEQMYCTAGVLLSQGQLIYRDFPFISHPPCHPLLLAAFYRVLPTQHYLLVGRLVSVLCEILVILAILGIYHSLLGRRRGSGLLLGLAAVSLFTFHPLVEYASGYAWNHDLVIVCVMLALWLFVTTDFQGRSRFWRTALIGALLALAVGTRITTVPVAALFLAAVLVQTPGGVKGRMQTGLAFCAAALAALMGPVWIFAQAPQAMWLDLTRIPALCAAWLQEKGFLFDKWQLSLVYLTTPGYLVLLALAVYLGAALARRWSGIDGRDRGNALLAVGVAALFFVIAYLPPAMWQQYLAVPVPFVAAALALPLAALHRQARETGKKRPFQVASCLLAVGAGAVVLANPTVLSRSFAVLVPERWVPVRLHRAAQEMAAKIEEPRRVLTLGPLYALEGNCDIYPELANPFTYRVADRLSAEERALTHTIGAASLNELIRDRPPAGVIVGVEPPYMSFLEDALRLSVPPTWRRETCGGTLQVHYR